MTNSEERKTKIEAMTWVEIRERLQSDPVVLVPVGSVEQHGPQTPVGDFRYIEHVAEQAAEKTTAITIPPLPFGYSEYFRPFPGCISLKHETLGAVLTDIFESLIAMGAQRFLVLCGHKGNMLTIEHVARDLLREKGVRIAVAEPWTWFAPVVCKRIYGTETPAIGHGGDPFTSLGLSLYEDRMRMDLVEEQKRSSWEGIRLLNPGAAILDETEVPFRLFLNMDEITSNGVLGDATIASPEIGEQLFAHVLEKTISIINYLKKLPLDRLQRSRGGGAIQSKE